MHILTWIENIIFSLVGLSLLIMAILIIVHWIKEEKKIKELDKDLQEFCDFLINQPDNDEESSSEMQDFDKMGIKELYKLAKEKKIPRYYEMKKSELIKSLKESK